MTLKKPGIDSNSKLGPDFEYGSLEWANQTLRNAIGFLQEGARSQGGWLWNQRLAVVLIYKKELLELGYTWQAERIDNWIHRLMRLIPNSLKGGQEMIADHGWPLQPASSRADLSERERGGGSF
jgi:hypothetical protein